MVRVKVQTLCRGTGWWLELLQWNLGSDDDDDGRLLLMYKTQTFISSLIKSGTKPILSFLWYEKFPRTNRNTSSVTGRIKLVGETKYTHKINTVSLHSFYVTQMTLIKDALSWKTLKHSHDAWSCFFSSSMERCFGVHVSPWLQGWRGELILSWKKKVVWTPWEGHSFRDFQRHTEARTVDVC